MSRGSDWVAAVKEEFSLNLAETIVADEIGEVLDVLDSPGLDAVEARQQRGLLSRLLYQINLPSEGESVQRSDNSRKASRAARARWSREQEVNN